jgi:hypothetical protein
VYATNTPDPGAGAMRREGEVQGKNEEINSDMYYSEDSYRSHKTREEDTEGDEDLLLTKRRKLPLIPTY